MYEAPVISEGTFTVLPVDTVSLVFDDPIPADWVVGDTLAGGTSGASADIVAISDDRTRVWLGAVTSGPFQDEDITNNDADAEATAEADVTYGSPAQAEYASGTITFGTPVDGDKILVNGIRFIFQTTPTQDNHFSDADELAALIDAMDEVSASNAGGTITVTALTIGSVGNAITLALGALNDGDSTLAVGSATLEGGVDGDTFSITELDGTVHTFTCVATIEDALTEFDDADALAALIDALDDVGAANAAGTITITAAAAGAASNAIAISSVAADDENDLVCASATLEGGITDPTYPATYNAAAATPALELDCRGASRVEIKVIDAADDIFISQTATKPAATQGANSRQLVHSATTVHTIDRPGIIKAVSASTKYPSVIYTLYR